jgi:amphiphysin
MNATGMLKSQVGFSAAFSTIFQPILNEASLASNHPEAANTLRNIVVYQDAMADLREAIQPELDLVDNRVVAPLKEYQELLKKVRKTVTKRDHKVCFAEPWNGS